MHKIAYPAFKPGVKNDVSIIALCSAVIERPNLVQICACSILLMSSLSNNLYSNQKPSSAQQDSASVWIPTPSTKRKTSYLPLKTCTVHTQTEPLFKLDDETIALQETSKQTNESLFMHQSSHDEVSIIPKALAVFFSVQCE